jgi:hypothetical protein
MPDRSKGRGHTKYSSWPTRFRGGLGDNHPTPETTLIVAKPPETKGNMVLPLIAQP